MVGYTASEILEIGAERKGVRLFKPDTSIGLDFKENTEHCARYVQY
jgi:hypothetical protein